MTLKDSLIYVSDPFQLHFYILGLPIVYSGAGARWLAMLVGVAYKGRADADPQRMGCLKDRLQ